MNHLESNFRGKIRRSITLLLKEMHGKLVHHRLRLDRGMLLYDFLGGSSVRGIDGALEGAQELFHDGIIVAHD